MSHLVFVQRAAQFVLVAACAFASATAPGQHCLCSTLADEFRASEAGLVREWIVQVPFDSGASRLERIVVGGGLAVAQTGGGGLHAIRTQAAGAGAGTIAWSQMIEAAAGHAWPPTIGSQLVVMPSELTVHALDRESGVVEWELPTAWSCAAAAVQSGDWVYAPLNKGQTLRIPVNPLAREKSAGPAVAVGGRGASAALPMPLDSLNLESISSGGHIKTALEPLPGGVAWTADTGPVAIAHKADGWEWQGLPESRGATWRAPFAMTRGARIIVAGADAEIKEFFERNLVPENYRVECVGTEVETLQAAGRQLPELFVIDSELRDVVELLTARLYAPGAKTRSVPCIVLTRPGGSEVDVPLKEFVKAAKEAMRRGLEPEIADFVFIAKPERFKAELQRLAARGARILVAGTDAEINDAVERNRVPGNYRVEYVGTGMATLQAAGRQPPDLFVIDSELRDVADLLTKRLYAPGVKTRSVPCIVLTRPGGSEVDVALRQFVNDATEAAKTGLEPGIGDFAFISKPDTRQNDKERVEAELQRLAARIDEVKLPRRGCMYAASESGRLMRIDLITSSKPGMSVAWSIMLPDRPVAAPLEAGGTVVVSLGPSGIAAYSAADGRELWRNGLVGTVVASTRGRVWLLDEVGRLSALDLVTGARRQSMCVGCFTLPVVNTSSERLILASPGGLVVSLAAPVNAAAPPAAAPAPADPGPMLP